MLELAQEFKALIVFAEHVSVLDMLVWCGEGDTAGGEVRNGIQLKVCGTGIRRGGERERAVLCTCSTPLHRLSIPNVYVHPTSNVHTQRVLCLVECLMVACGYPFEAQKLVLICSYPFRQYTSFLPSPPLKLNI